MWLEVYLMSLDLTRTGQDYLEGMRSKLYLDEISIKSILFFDAVWLP